MIRRYFIAGLLIWVPLWATLLVIKFLVDVLDNTLALLPKAYQPDTLIGFHIPGLGLVFSILVVFFTGMIVTNFIGRHLVAFWDGLLARIPLVRSIHSAVKQVVHTLLSPTGDSFRKVLLVEYPRRGSYSVAFLTSSGLAEAEKKLDEDLVTVFVPTTPNPTSGFLILVPRKETIELDMTIDEAFRMVISLGVVLPKSKVEKLKDKAEVAPRARSS